MKLCHLILFIWPLWCIGNEEGLTRLSQQAEALWEAHDYVGASKIYEQLMSHPLPDWQQSRLAYNLGTIRLAQHQPADAMAFFQKIKPSDLSLPQFGLNILLNEGIAYFQIAQTLALTFPSSLDLQVLYFEQSLQVFNQAHLLGCQLQKSEQSSNPAFSCMPHPLIDPWIQSAQLQLQRVYRQKRQQWIEQLDGESLATYLRDRLEDFKDLVHTSLSSSKESSLAYLQQQISSFVPIWKALQQKEFADSEKHDFEEAANAFLSAMIALNQQDLPSVMKEINKSIDSVTSLGFHENIDVQEAHLHYEVLLLQENLDLSSVQALLKQFEALKVEEEKFPLLEKIKAILKRAIEELKAGHSIDARFFLLAGFSQVDALFKTQEVTPTMILRDALDQANRSLQLLFLAEGLTNETTQRSEIIPILKTQQHDVLVQATPFIPAVLKQQNLSFHQAKDPADSCQQSPWDQVIPLFDQGHQAAQMAEKQLNRSPLNPAGIMNNQGQTIENWQRALNLLLHPPEQVKQKNVPTSEQMTETIRQIQEMYLEDQSQPQQKIEELHSW
jgi:hypothetical protein